MMTPGKDTAPKTGEDAAQKAREIRVCLFQPPYPHAGTEAAAAECRAWMQEQLDALAPEDQDLILLPEYATAPGLQDRERLRACAESEGAAFLDAAASAARRLHCSIALAAPVRDGTSWFNRTLVFDRGGEIALTYDKVHLTDAETQDLGMTPGMGPAVLEYEGLRLGFATCFDLYFPEHFEALAAQHVQVILSPSYQRSETAARIGLIARMRALDSGAYVLRSSYSMGEGEVGGRTLVATPAGELAADAGAAPGVIAAALVPARKFTRPASHGRPLVEHRKSIEAHRRPSMYRDAVRTARALNEAPFPHLCAHRGVSHACPENTLPAFAAAMAAGAHEIEFDVHPSRDGVPVICHDPSVDRTTDGTGQVAELTWDEIRRLDAGSSLHPAWAGVRIPRLEEVLQLTGGRIRLNVHVGGDVEEPMLRRICDLLRDFASADLAYLALGSESALQIARDYAPDIPRACLVSQNDPDTSIAVARRYGCGRIQFFRQVTAEQVRQAHESGLVCNMFWSDDPEDAREYVRRGIDVILTNRAYMLFAGGVSAPAERPQDGHP